MSLSVYLVLEPTSKRGSGIFVRRNGENVEITREEWDQAFPGQEPVFMAAEYGVDCTVYSRNITHNLGGMAHAAGLYEACWRPEERGWSKAKDLIEPLSSGLGQLASDPKKYEIFNPSNGWGDYGQLVSFVSDYLKACNKYPEATIHVSR